MNDSARKSVPKSAGMLTRSWPTGVSTSFCNSSWAIWASATISWQRSKYRRPASVSSTLRVVRLSRRSPGAFEFGHLARQSRLGDAQAGGGAAETMRLGHFDEELHAL